MLKCYIFELARQAMNESQMQVWPCTNDGFATSHHRCRHSFKIPHLMPSCYKAKKGTICIDNTLSQLEPEFYNMDQSNLTFHFKPDCGGCLTTEWITDSQIKGFKNLERKIILLWKHTWQAALGLDRKETFVIMTQFKLHHWVKMQQK